MAETPSTEEVKEQIRSARADLRNDIAALDHQVHVDIPARVADNAAILTAGGAALGALIGFGGRKAIKGLIAIGAAAAAGSVLLKRRG
jgi:hypothetical protein